jgi:hypothetical protein
MPHYISRKYKAHYSEREREREKERERETFANVVFTSGD